MKYQEKDYYSGILESCYLNPRYHAGCLMCVDKEECYGMDEYMRFRSKAIIMSDLLDNKDALVPWQAERIARAMGMPGEIERVVRLLERDMCPDKVVEKIIKMALENEAKTAGGQTRAEVGAVPAAS
ncbi:MAG: hypothetical protein ABFD04_09960 [Syntrophomonas sp.]